MTIESIDLRSDTVTRPTQEMYEAMQKAVLGDDVLEGDPTVKQLQELAAKKIGKEAALFVPSGCMANLVALTTHTAPGDNVILEEQAHLFMYEAAAAARFGQVLTRTLSGKNGVLDPQKIEEAILTPSDHTPKTTLIWLENTHNRAGGIITPQGHMKAYQEISKRHHIPIHLDGARIFNAAITQNIDAREITQYVDTVTFCLSKGLGSPVGSLVCGSEDFIERAKLNRKRLGGSMRQSGILAACGIVSLNKHIDRLGEDHQRAKTFAASLQNIPGLKIHQELVQTNIVMIHTEKSGKEWIEAMKEFDVHFFAVGPKQLRIIFHLDINDDKMKKAIEAFKICAKNLA